MSDDTIDPSLLASHRTRRNIVIASLLYSWIVIAILLQTGDATNSLHTSALAWSFATNIGVIFAYSFGTVLSNLFKK